MTNCPWKICVITGARSEYGMMRWLMEDLKNAPEFDLQVMATASHLSPLQGYTYKQIEADGFHLDAKLPVDVDHASPLMLAEAVGELTRAIAKSFIDLEPDLVLAMGDRYELLSLISASVLMTVPIAHVSGGEITEGAIDEQIRHAMTKAAHLHLVSNETHARRVRQMGEEKWRICVSGEPGLDNLFRQPKVTRAELFDQLGLYAGKATVLVTYHPVTLEMEDLERQIHNLRMALDIASKRYDFQFLITYPNTDAGHGRIIAEWEDFVASRPDRVLVKTLGQTRYLSALRECTMMIGNSSSGLVEAPSFALSAINIGTRQAGRERGRNVIDVGYKPQEILDGIERGLAFDRDAECPNPYGDGRSSERVLAFLRDIYRNRTRDELLRKRFAEFNS